MARTLSYDVIPFKDQDTGEQWYTLVEKWYEDGKIVEDFRRRVPLEVFKTLHDSVVKAAEATFKDNNPYLKMFDNHD